MRDDRIIWYINQDSVALKVNPRNLKLSAPGFSGYGKFIIRTILHITTAFLDVCATSPHLTLGP